MVKSLGSFLVVGDKIHVSDPCYDYDCVGAVTLGNVLSGKYLASLTSHVMDSWGSRVAKLTIEHEDYQNVSSETFTGAVAVDSGQVGFFDDDYYRENQGGEFGDVSTLFGLACALTLSKNHGGITNDRGVVSETGFGDGYYSLYVGKNDIGKIVAVSIIFIDDEELEEF